MIPPRTERQTDRQTDGRTGGRTERLLAIPLISTAVELTR